MRLSPLNYRSLFLLYGISAIVLVPFGGAYAYASTHGWDRSHALLVCLVSGVGVAVLVWAKLEPRLLAAQPAKVNLKIAMPQIFGGLPIPQIAAVGVFVAAVTCSPLPFRKNLTTATSGVSFKFVVGTQLTSDQAADQTATGVVQNVIRT